MRFALAAAVALSVIALGGILLHTRAAQGPTNAPGLPAQTLAGPHVALTGLRGHRVLVTFFASWCEPCVREAATLAAIQDRLGDARLVAIDVSDDRGEARALARRAGWRFPVLFDGGGVTSRRWRIAGLPSTFLLDGTGEIVTRLEGPQSAARLLAAASARS